MEIYRIKHKPTGLYFMPSRDGMNISQGGKVYDHPQGWLMFQKTVSLGINRNTRIGKLIANGEIAMGEIVWPKDWSYMKKDMKWGDLPDKTDAIKFHITINHSEWEKEILNTL